MTPQGLQRAADLLLAARRSRQPLECLPEDCRPANVDEGYAIQDVLVRKLASPPVGWKIGSTNPVAQKLVGAKGPFAARLLQANYYKSPASIPAAACIVRAIEPEFAFRMHGALPPRREPYSRAEVVSAVAALVPSIEVSDTRYHDWSKVGVASLIADNGNEGCFIAGPDLPDWRRIDLINSEAAVVVNGTRAATGTGRNVLGDPVEALVWLANDLSERNIGLRAGEIVTTGTCAGVTMVRPGDDVTAEFGALGTVRGRFLAV